MYEYKVETITVINAADRMNQLAKKGWRVIAVSPNLAIGFGLVVTYEKEKQENNLDNKKETKEDESDDFDYINHTNVKDKVEIDPDEKGDNW